MTYQKFCDDAYFIEREKEYYCWVNVTHNPALITEEEKEKYIEYRRKAEKISKFEKEALTKALANLPDDYFL